LLYTYLCSVWQARPNPATLTVAGMEKSTVMHSEESQMA
jgi:hypothetical protein